MATKRYNKWQEETEHLREILLACGLTEERKWGKPGFTFEGKNVAIIIGLKESCRLLFFKGALFKDPKGLLEEPGQTQSGRWFSFTSVPQIAKLKPAIKTYTQEAITIERSGLKVKKKATSEYPVLEELQQKFKQLPALKKAFATLTPGRQRAYLLYFAGAKQSVTRESRIAKHKQRILSGKGLDD